MGWLFGVIKELELKYKDKLFYKINEATVVSHGCAILLNSTQSMEEVDSIECNKVFKLVYDVAKDYISFIDIINKLKQMYPNCNHNKLKSFLDKLIIDEYLISDLRPPLTIPCQFEYFLEKLKVVLPNEICTNKLIKILNNINLYSKINGKSGEKLYEKLIIDMQNIHESDNYLQVDAKSSFACSCIKKSFINELNNLLNILMKFNSQNLCDKYWSDYKNKFLNFYGENRLVKLLDVLDEDYGIGLPDEYKNNFDNSHENNNIYPVDLSYYFYDKYCYALKNGLDKIEITDEELNSLNLLDYNYENIPESLELIFSMMKKKDKFIFELGEAVGSIAAGKAFGRFSHMMENQKNFFDDINESHKKLHADPEYITCEVSFVPLNTRAANVVCNSHKSDYEISLSTTNSHDSKKQLFLDDIMLGLENNKFYLKSQSLNKRILITVNHMLNSSFFPNIVRFLADVMAQDRIKWGVFPWKILFNQYTYIPTIVYKNFVLQSERWKINRSILSLSEKCSFNEFLNQFNLYVKHYKVYQYVYIKSVADNKLLINIKNKRCLKILYNELLKKSSTIWLCRFYNELEAPVKRGNEHYLTELFIPLKKVNKFNENNKKYKREIIENSSNFNKSMRFKRPLDDWLYFNLYGIRKDINNLIGVKINNFFSKLKNQGKIDDYFFTRCLDSKEHVCLCIKGSRKDLVEIYSAIDAWFKLLIENYYISKFNIDCYVREVECYGGANCIDYAEKVFAQDGYACANIFKLKIKEKLTISNEILGIFNILNYLDAFELTLMEKLEFLDKDIPPSLNRDTFKEEKNVFIKIALNYINNTISDNEQKIVLKIFDRRKKSLKSYLKQICKIHGDNKNIKYQILDRLIHTSMNRLFGPEVEHELKIKSYTRHIMYALCCMERKHALNIKKDD